MEKDPSPLDTLRQLNEWLEKGLITPQEFDTLKKKLLFSDATPAPGPIVPPVAPPAPAPRTPDPAAPIPMVPPVATTPVPPPAPVPTASSPVEDPLLPPVTSRPLHTPYVADPPVPPTSGPGISHPLEAGRPGSSPTRDDAFVPSSQPVGVGPEPLGEVVEDEPYAAPPKSPLGTILIVGGIIALLALVAYLMWGNQDSERLTSTTLTAADSVTTAPEVGPQSEQIDLPPAAAPETVRVAPAVPLPTTPSDSVNPATPAAAPTEEATPPAPEPVVDESAAQTRIEGVLKNYYADLQAAPFSASSYFAPRVERFYLQQNTTPTAITAELEKSHFPEFLEGQTTIEPGSLKVSPPVSDGSRVVTFIEKSTALRQSLQKRQQTTAQVRVRFDKNFKIVYLRQERLLENTFSE
ncbi:hypothetical protein K3G63_11785 [Hymenobacter sp. HSC-4F20]|uniref:SHOCT domain-containing protein n=1 Tax=Hymenobacter sp. HSC-4F20 TaxID=2864135 RepID=UPI001C738BAC|nr:SHOCT domain-containing protein [Hymenobacter sp. HSC-4F20]MBX0291127.1 hypothetical protein [Hymenobacter sp. HSC-4F20]